MKKVALVSHSCYVCGAEKMLYNLAILLKHIKLFPVVFIPKSITEQPLKELCDEKDISYVETNSYSLYIHFCSENKIPLSYKMKNEIEEYKRIFLETGIEIVINNTLTSPVAVIAANELKIPVITWIHGVLDTYLLNNAFESDKKLLFDRLILSISDCNIACSSWVRNYYENMSLSLIKVIPNWTSQFEEVNSISLNDTKPPIFVCFNTFENNKGIFVLLEASRILKENGKKFEVHFYGEGVTSFKKKMHAYVKKHKLESVVIIKSKTNDIKSVYEECYCLVQPSYLESFGMTIIEAMSYARPVIASKSGGPEDTIIDGVTGFLVERDDAKTLAVKMEELLFNPLKALEMGRNGYKRYQDYFSEASIKKEVEKILNDVVKTEKNRKEKLLYHDMLVMLLNTPLLANIVPENCKINSIHPVRAFISDDLCFSGKIKSRKYGIITRTGKLNVIGIIFGDTIAEKLTGNVVMRILERGKLLAESSVKIENIVIDQWTYFYFDNVAHSEKLVIEISIEYTGNDGNLGVFEEKQNRTFWYKVFNKLKKPIYGRNVLFYVLQ